MDHLKIRGKIGFDVLTTVMDHLKIRGTIGFDVLNLIGVLELSSQLKIND